MVLIWALRLGRLKFLNDNLTIAMNIKIKLLTFILVFLFFVSFPTFAKKNPDQVVLEAAKSWLAKFDKAQLSDCYNDSARFMQVLVKKEQWLAMLQQMQKQTGVADSRYVLKKEFETQLNGLPKGTYTILIFETNFTNGIGHEKIIMTEESGKWKVAGYSATNK